MICNQENGLLRVDAGGCGRGMLGQPQQQQQQQQAAHERLVRQLHARLCPRFVVTLWHSDISTISSSAVGMGECDLRYNQALTDWAAQAVAGCVVRCVLRILRVLMIRAWMQPVA